MDEVKTKEFVDHLPKDKPLYWFHAVGMSSGSYKLSGDGNRWLPFQQVTREMFETEAIPFWVATMNMAKALWPYFQKQKCTKVVLLSSMSALRTYIFGASHCPAEAVMDRLGKVLTLEGYKDNIFVTLLRAGAIDTGTYDSENVIKNIKIISKDYGCDWDNGLRPAPPSSIAEAAACAFISAGHISGINLVSQGQLPHELS
jgi:NADP-dependent 3-hydroxy acid dehydrogenase YdfG